MIGFYDYTVILTYLSLACACTGIITTFSGGGQPYIGVLCLLISGCLDAFDGRVARRKKDRTDMQMSFGVQIDSLSDLVAFGVLPACIGACLVRNSSILVDSMAVHPKLVVTVKAFMYAVLVLFVLAALIRLAYFNVLEEERKKRKDTSKKGFIGVPVTMSALVFPTVLLIQYMTGIDLSFLYVGLNLFLGVAFLLKIRIQKPTIKGILIMIIIGAIEYGAFLTFSLLRR